jgi:hypothetical protein
MTNNEFKEWAQGFSGCDGGNPSGRIWLCGIEFGGGHTEKTLIYDDVTKPPCITNKDDFIRYQYNWKAIKLLAALNGRECAKYKTFFEEQSCFHEKSNYFKLNLYPIGFKDTAHHRWGDWIILKTGFATKLQYLDWCKENRFPVLRRWLVQYSPRLVLCTGVTRRGEFRSAFGDGTEKVIEGKAGGKDFNYFLTNDRKTMVATVYFLGGKYGLGSDDQLAATGKQLASVLYEEYGSSWMSA